MARELKVDDLVITSRGMVGVVNWVRRDGLTVSYSARGTIYTESRQQVAHLIDWLDDRCYEPWNPF